MAGQEVDATEVFDPEFPSCCCTFVVPELMLKLLLMRYGTGLLIPFFAMLATSVVSAQESPLVLEQSSETNTAPRTGLFMGASVGYGTFQDLVINETQSAFSFGTENAEPKPETVSHSGLPLALNLGYSARNRRFLNDARIDFLYMNKTDPVAEERSNNASYSRLRLSTGTRWHLIDKESYQPYILTRGELRRTAYSNLSNGHMLDALVPYVGFGLAHRRWYRVEAFIGYSVYAKFGFNDGKGFSNRGLDAKSSLQEVGLKADYFINPLASVGMSVIQESVLVELADARQYADHGFNIVSPSPEPRRYQLESFVMLFNLTKTL